MLPRQLYEHLREEEKRDACLLAEWEAWPCWLIRDREEGRVSVYRPLPEGWWENRLEDLAILNEILGKQCYTHRKPIENWSELVAAGLVAEFPALTHPSATRGGKKKEAAK